MIYGRHNQHLRWGAWIRGHILDAHVQRGWETKPRGVRGLGLAACCVTDGLPSLRARCSSPLVVGDCDMWTYAHVPFPLWPPRKSFCLPSLKFLTGSAAQSWRRNHGHKNNHWWKFRNVLLLLQVLCFCITLILNIVLVAVIFRGGFRSNKENRRWPCEN